VGIGLAHSEIEQGVKSGGDATSQDQGSIEDLRSREKRMGNDVGLGKN
jgi:hypothetical protein